MGWVANSSLPIPTDDLIEEIEISIDEKHPDTADREQDNTHDDEPRDGSHKAPDEADESSNNAECLKHVLIPFNRCTVHQTLYNPFYLLQAQP